MPKFKVKDFVRHKVMGKEVILWVINVGYYDGREDAFIYTCRYFSNGIFYTEDFYEYELIELDTSKEILN